MSNQFDREGTFRGDILNHSVNSSTGGYPQLVLRVKATEMYDEDSGEWVGWAEFDMQVVGYLVLFNNKGPCMNYEQAQKATGWNGQSFAGLDQLELAGHQIQFRIAANEYEGKTRLQLDWLDEVGADPVRALQKLDAAGLKALDAKHGLGKVSTPVSAPAAPPKAPPAAPETIPETAPAAAPPKRKAAAAPPKRKAAAPPPPTTADETFQGGDNPTSTKEKAWETVVELKTDEVKDDALNAAWLTTIAELAPDGDEDKITPEGWAQVLNKTLSQIDHIPF